MYNKSPITITINPNYNETIPLTGTNPITTTIANIKTKETIGNFTVQF